MNAITNRGLPLRSLDAGRSPAHFSCTFTSLGRKKNKIPNEGLACSDAVSLNVIWWNTDEPEWEEEAVLVNLVRRSELICVYRAPDIHSFRSEVGAISSQSVGVGSNGAYGQSDVQALSLVASPVRMSIWS